MDIGRTPRQPLHADRPPPRHPLHRQPRILFAVGTALLLARFIHAARPGFRPASLWLDDEWVKEAVKRLNDVLRDEDALIVYPWSNYAVGYYGRWPARFVEVEDSTNGFYVEPQRSRSLVLRETFRGISFNTQRAAISEQLGPFLSGGFPTLVYLAVRGPCSRTPGS